MIDKADKSEVASLGKAFQVLEYITQKGGELSLKDIATGTRIPKATLIRLLTTMKHHGVIRQDSDSKNYQLGWALIFMGAMASKVFSLPKIIHPYLQQLSQEAGETASLVQIHGDMAVYIDQVSCGNLISGGLGIGSKLMMHSSASGKILISTYKNEEIRKYLERNPLTKLTDNTILDTEDFIREIENVRKNGYAIDDQEGELGCCCIAAPLYDWNNKQIAAISITGPTSRINKYALPKLVECVCRIAGEASRAFEQI